jgi:signal transduction histidine kinase/ligand-binding sensor domain-containing protein
MLRRALVGLFAAAACLAAFGIESNRTIEQFTHTAWSAKEGAPSAIFAITQTEDGYLWLGSAMGLFRFDGTTIERYEPQTGPTLPTGGVRSLLALPDGDLWIGYFDGAISLLKNGRAENYTKREGVPNGIVLSLAQDREGAIWAATNGGLARLDGNRWQEIGKEWNFHGKSASAVFLDSEGSLWVATDEKTPWVPGENTLVYLPQGARSFQSTSIHLGVVSQFVEAANGKLWMAETSRSVRPVPLGNKLPPVDETEVRVGSQAVLFTREGDLWITSVADGIQRVPAPERLKGKPDRFGSGVEDLMAKNGLTDDVVLSIFEDRDDNIWVGTYDGFDRFRKKELVPVVLPVVRRDPILIPGDRGEVWAFLRERIFHIGKSYTDEIQNPGGPEIDFAYRDSTGVPWWISQFSLIRFEGGHSFKYPLPKEVPTPFWGSIRATEDQKGVLWLAAEGFGLFYRENGIWSRFNIPPEIAKSTPRAAFTDELGRVWFGYQQGAIIDLNGEQLQTVSTNQSSPVPGVSTIGGRNRHVWVGGDAGLALFDGGKFDAMIPADYPKFRRVSGIEELADGSLWLCETRGVIHIDAGEVRSFLQTPSYHVHYEIFDSRDGLPGDFLNDSRKLTEGSDGRLWFGATGGVAWLNPADIPKNQPPPASIRSVTADGKRFTSLGNLTLPSRITNLQIEYGALNLSTPERVHFRYELERADKGWQEAGVRHEALYTKLGPGKYRFHVGASNEGGEWSNADTVFEFSIAPAWFQTVWFRSLCVALVLVLVWALYLFRVKQLKHQFSMALEARVDERTRIARELHDTLLQSFQGITLHFQRARNLLPDRTGEAIETLDTALDGAEDAIVEGRDAILDLRSLTTDAKTLAEEIKVLGEELVAKDANTKESREFRIVIEGSACAMRPNLHVEVFRIAREALRNAFSHSQGHLIETEMAYTDSMFRLRIRDDGKGIDLDERARAERIGHWGLKGMRERAEHLGGELEVWSEPGAGTEIELRVPASIAYETALSPDSPWQFWRRKRNP